MFFCTGLFLLGEFINNRKTLSGAILLTDILYSLFKYSNKVLLGYIAMCRCEGYGFHTV